MVETPDTRRKSDNPHPEDAGVSAHDLKAWFVREVLPLEASLVQFLRQNWRHTDDIADLRQDVYVRVYESAHKEIPHSAKSLVFTIARNLLIDRYRHNRIVPIEGVADLEAIDIASDEPGPDRSMIARDELRHLKNALDRLPPRCREAMMLKRVERLTRTEIAQRMGISENTVKRHLTDAAHLLADMLYMDRSGPEATP
jgi:RNA polymerase sigma factor (sigma-70 family)